MPDFDEDEEKAIALFRLLENGEVQVADLIGVADIQNVLRAGLQCLESRRYEQAERLFLAAMALRTDLPLAYLFLGKVHEARKQWANAEILYTISILLYEKLDAAGLEWKGHDILLEGLEFVRSCGT